MGISVEGWPWFAIQVRTGTEKTSSAVLKYKGYECFLPLGRSRRRWSDRIKQLDLPLFPGYLFCRFDPDRRLPVLTVPGVLQIVGIGKTPLPVAEDEIAALQRIGMNGLPVQPWPFLQVGQMARIEYGPLRGLTGIVIQIKSEIKLILSVCLLQRSVAVEVDRAWMSEPYPLDPAEFEFQRGASTLDRDHLAQDLRGFADRPAATD